MLYIKSDIKFRTRKDLIKHVLRYRQASYYDEDCKNVQCDSDKNRSITELHEIVLSKFPKTSFDAMMRIITDLIDDKVGIGIIWCTQIHKVVVRNFNQAERNYITEYSKSRYFYEKGADGYSLADYDKIIKKFKN